MELTSRELLDHLKSWQEREAQAERAAAYARTQQARIVGELAIRGVHVLNLPNSQEGLSDV